MICPFCIKGREYDHYRALYALVKGLLPKEEGNNIFADGYFNFREFDSLRTNFYYCYDKTEVEDKKNVTVLSFANECSDIADKAFHGVFLHFVNESRSKYDIKDRFFHYWRLVSRGGLMVIMAVVDIRGMATQDQHTLSLPTDYLSFLPDDARIEYLALLKRDMGTFSGKVGDAVNHGCLIYALKREESFLPGEQ